MFKIKNLNLVLTVILSIVFLTFSVESAEKKQAETKPVAVKTVVPNNITQTAMKAGINACAARMNQVTNFLAGNTQGAQAMIFMSPENPDRQLVSLSLEIPVNNNYAYASASFAPNQAKGCNGMYETVVYWPQKCAEVAEKQFGSFKKAGMLSKNIYMKETEGTAKVFLMPAGTGCVAIKKEVVQ